MIRSKRQHRKSGEMTHKAVLEALETRQLLSTYTVGAGGNFTTLQAAANVVKAGDVVNVAAGNYAGFQLSTSGTAGSPITWNAAAGTVVNGAPADLNGEIDISGCSYVTLNGFDIELNGSTASRAGIWGGGYAGSNVNGLVIENNTVNGADWWGILFGFISNSQIVGNTVSNTQVQHGIYLGNSPTNDLISDNTCFNNRGCGIEINADKTQGGPGVATGIVISDNRLYNNAQGIGAAINFDGVQNSIIENNLIYNANRNGIALYQIDGADCPTGDTIVNNTIVQNGNGATGYAAISLLNGAANTTILNNVLSSAENAMSIDSGSQSGLNSDYNVFGASGIDPTGDSYSNNVNFSSWQAMGYDQHSTYVGSAVNSLFVNAAAGDFHLVAGSAAIGAGTSSNAPATDFYGNARPTSGRYDVGAIQYQGQPAPTPPASPPTAKADSYSVQNNQTLTVSAPGVLANDSDPNGLSLSAVLANGPTHGTLTLSANGSFVYKPTSGYVGSDSFAYTATDGEASSSAASVSITVTAPPASPPTAKADSYSVQNNQTLTVSAPGVLANDSDPNGLSLSASLASGPTHGTLTLNSNGSFVYTPTSGYVGSDSFTYTATDGQASSSAASVTITVTAPPATPPTANGDSYQVQSDQTLTVSAPGVLANDSDPNGLSLSAALATGPAHGTLTLSADGSFVYTPASGYVGSDSFAYIATDGQASSSAASVTITVTAPPPATPTAPQAPTANDDSYQVQNNQMLSVSAPGVLANDSDPNGLSLSAALASGPAHGALTLYADGSLDYTPTSGYVGSDSFTYTATDGQASSSPATVTINVTAPPVVDPAPVTSVPTAPTNLLAQTEWGNCVALNWSDTAGDASQFKIQRSDDGGVTFNVIATVDASVTSYVDNGLASPGIYMYQVIATNALGDSAPSNTAYAKTYNGASWREMSSVWMPAQQPSGTTSSTSPVASTPSDTTPSGTTPVASSPNSSDPTVADNVWYQRPSWLLGDQSNPLD
ncbi:MAG: Ig-like domain-containing protein [Tepidisphaeraceae bacterium]